MAFSSRSRSLFDMRVLVFAALVFVLVGALPGRADDTSALSMGGGRNHHHARRIVRPLAGLCDELANDVTALGVDLSDPYAPALVESFPTKCMVYRSPAGSKDAIIHVNVPVTLQSVQVDASFPAATFPETAVTLMARTLPRFARALKTSQGPSFEPIGRAALKSEGFHNLTGEDLARLMSAQNSDGEARAQGADGPDHLVVAEVGWTSEASHPGHPHSDALNALTRSSSRYNPAVNGEDLLALEALAEEWRRDHQRRQEGETLEEFLEGRAAYHAGQGGSLGRWELRTPGGSGVVEEWSLRMCFDPVANYAALCRPNESAADAAAEEAAIELEEDLEEEPRVKAMAGPPGGLGARVASALAPRSSSGSFCIPGLRVLCDARERRIEEDKTCAEAAHSWNPFTRMTENFCCKKFRWLFWRSWLRKNLNLGCRRFYRQ